MTDFPIPSGLYNILCGRNPMMPYLFGFIGITKETENRYPLGRFRDITLSSDGKEIHIFARNGSLPNISRNLEKHPNFLATVKQEDEYVTYVFTIDQFYTVKKSGHPKYPQGRQVDQWRVIERFLPIASYIPMIKFKEALKKIENKVKISDEVEQFNKEMTEKMSLVMNTGEDQIVSTSQGATVIVSVGPVDDNGQFNIGVFDADYFMEDTV